MILGNVNSLNDSIKSSRIMKRRKLLGFNDPENISSNLPKFLHYLHNDYSKKLNGFTWAEFVESYLDKNDVFIVKYEDMLANTSAQLEKVLSFLDYEVEETVIHNAVDKFSFKNQTKRNPGEENKKSFLRKGIAGDWKNYFNKESVNLFDKYYGDMLIKLGYEDNRDWLKDFK